MYANEQKLFKIGWMKSHIIAARKAGLFIKEEMLIGEFIMNFGSSKRTALEYLSGLGDAGFIVREEGEIFLNEKMENEIIAGRTELEKVKNAEEVKINEILENVQGEKECQELITQESIEKGQKKSEALLMQPELKG